MYYIHNTNVKIKNMPFTKLYNFNFVCLATHNSSDRPNMGNNGMSEQGRIFSRNNGSSVGSSYEL